jgi:hypothetical protein
MNRFCLEKIKRIERDEYLSFLCWQSGQSVDVRREAPLELVRFVNNLKIGVCEIEIQLYFRYVPIRFFLFLPNCSDEMKIKVNSNTTQHNTTQHNIQKMKNENNEKVSK